MNIKAIKNHTQMDNSLCTQHITKWLSSHFKHTINQKSTFWSFFFSKDRVLVKVKWEINLLCHAGHNNMWGVQVLPQNKCNQLLITKFRKWRLVKIVPEEHKLLLTACFGGAKNWLITWCCHYRWHWRPAYCIGKPH